MEANMIGNRLISMGLLVSLSATSAHAQTDLLWQHSDGRLAVWKMQGWVQMSGDLLNPGQLPDPRWQLAASSDFNLDGHADHIFQHQADGRLAIWLMNGDSQVRGFALTPDRAPDVNWKVRGAADFDGDTRPDLLFQNAVTGEVSIWRMFETTRVGTYSLPSVPDTDWRIVGVADFDANLNPDIFWQHQSNGLVALWWMRSFGVAGGGLIDGVLVSNRVSDPNLKIRAVGYINDDVFPDLVWQHQATGLLATWIMGTAWGQETTVLLSPDHVLDTDWHIVGIPTPRDLVREAGFWVKVFASDDCIFAKVEIVGGQAIGQSATNEGDCDPWGFGGAFFRGLRAGIAVTVRASAPGYLSQEITIMPTPVGQGMTATVITLPRIQTP
jgi:VCBS repeat protein